MIDAIRHSAERIWLAGLAAFTRARGNSGKTFETLAREGAHLQAIARSLAEERVAALSHSVDSVSQRLGDQAAQSWDHLEQIFEDRVARTLTRLGVPTSAEVQALMDRVDALTEALRGMQVPAAAHRPVGRRAKPASRSAAAKASSGKAGPRRSRSAPAKARGAKA